MPLAASSSEIAQRENGWGGPDSRALLYAIVTDAVAKEKTLTQWRLVEGAARRAGRLAGRACPRRTGARSSAGRYRHGGGSGRAGRRLEAWVLTALGSFPTGSLWGPPLAYVTVPGVPMRFLVVRSSADVNGHSHQEVEGQWTGFVEVLTRAKAPSILQDLMSTEQLGVILAQVDLALGIGLRRHPSP